MKTILKSEFTFEKVRKYWRQINAPVCLRRCTSVEGQYSIIKMPGAPSDFANAFILCSADISVLDRDVMFRKMKLKAVEPAPVIVLDRIWGKML